MNTKKWRVALGVSAAGAAGILVIGLTAVPVEATPDTADSKILVQTTIKPTTLWSHGRTAAGDRWGLVMATYGTTDGFVVDNKFARGQSTGWHKHPGPSLIYVVTGTITNYDSGAPGCAPRSYPAGSTFTDAGGTDVHMLRNDGDLPAETIAVQFIPHGQPRRIDVAAEPANCA